MPTYHDIARRLGEDDQAVIDRIKRIVKLCGLEQALTWADEAEAIQAAGGEMTRDGTRKRTLGGVFFRMVKDRVTQDQFFRIFPPPPKEPAAGPPPFDYATRQFADEEPGRIDTVKVSLVGRPEGGATQHQGVVVLRLINDTPPKNLPAGLPPPPTEPTRHLVFVSPKQWRKVESALKTDPSDRLIIEGWAGYDSSIKGVAIWANRVTTVATERAKKPTPPPAD